MFISENQADFTSGRVITENVILVKKIVQIINKSNDKDNMIIKLDMKKIL